MRLLIAEDDQVSRRFLEHTLTRCGYEVVVTSDGTAAWQALEGPDAPPLAILDWVMPGLEGLEICRRLRLRATPTPTYIILLTAKSGKDEIVAGLRAGADDYLTKPFDLEELRARVLVGFRLIELQRKLADRVQELADALAHVKQLRGLLPICAWCKKVRDDKNYWQQLETYVSRHSDAQFSHGICPECYRKVRATIEEG
jgi:sigma-B regulation protein RsbU (phosphoserine phosphatase)